MNKVGISVCVFCGSSFGARPEYERAAEELGQSIAARGWRLVYGGAHVGLMGRLADAALEAGGRVIGVIPRQLEEMEIAHRGLTELIAVETMHERKARMADLSDAIVALPGAYGTLDELFDIVTWRQLRLHAKPIVVVNLAGYYDGLLDFLNRTVAEGFLKASNRLLLSDAGSVAEALEVIEREAARMHDFR